MMEMLAIKPDALEGPAPPARAASDSAAGSDFSTELGRRLEKKTDAPAKSAGSAPKHSTGKGSSPKDDDPASKVPPAPAALPGMTVAVIPPDVRSGVAEGDTAALDSARPAGGVGNLVSSVSDAIPVPAEDLERPQTTVEAVPGGIEARTSGESVAAAPEESRDLKRAAARVQGGDAPGPVGPLRSGSSPVMDATEVQANETAAAEPAAKQTIAPILWSGRDEASQAAGNRDSAVPLHSPHSQTAGPAATPEGNAALRLMSHPDAGTRLQKASAEAAAASKTGTVQPEYLALLSKSPAAEGPQPAGSAGAHIAVRTHAETGHEAQIPIPVQPSGSPAGPPVPVGAAAVQPPPVRPSSNASEGSPSDDPAPPMVPVGASGALAGASPEPQHFRNGSGGNGQQNASAGRGEREPGKGKIPDDKNAAGTVQPFAPSAQTERVERGAVYSEKAGAAQPRLPTASAVAAEGYEARAGRIVNSARIIQQAGNSEMQVRLRSDEFGPIEVRTVVKGGDIGASFHVQARDVQMALANELPQLERALNERSLRVEHLDVLQGSISGGSSDATGSGASQGNPADTRNPFASYSSDPAYAFLPEAQTVSEDWNSGLSNARINLRV